MLIYGAVGAVGFLLLIFMLVAGDVFGGDHDIAGHEIAGDHLDSGHGGPGIFSVRIMAAFLTAFGVGGVVGRYYGLSHPAASGVGVLGWRRHGRARVSVRAAAALAASVERAENGEPRRQDRVRSRSAFPPVASARSR